MTADELNELQVWLDLRRQVITNPPEDEDFVMPPEPACVHTAEGAVLWAMTVFWQDAPILMVVGCIALSTKLLIEVWNISRRLLG